MADGGSYHYQHDPYRDSPASQRTPVSPLLPAQRLPLLLRTPERDVNDLTYHIVSPIMSRSPSIASDSRFSVLSGGTGTFPATPANVRPPAAYVAPFGAAQVVSEHQISRASGFSSDDDDDDENTKPSKDDVSFSPSALALINAFLDQLLYSFLLAAKSTNLHALRLAVTDILRHKLARDAIASADEELSELLAGGDEDDEKDDKYNDGQKWDLELVWRRTRLRVMVYTRIGDMEDEDEERHVKEQELFAHGERGRFSSTAGLVSWSAAIFLTSVLEYVAEQSLKAAGQAAFSRFRRRDNAAEERHNLPDSAAVVISEQDVERIALNPALGRLWRSWRKTMRANVRPTTPAPRADVPVVSPTTKSLSSPRDSFGTAPESAHGDDDEPEERELPDTRYPEHVLASNIRLPMGDPLRDVDEIEVPGLARDPSESGSQGDVTPIAARPDRRRSFSNYQSRQAEQLALSSATIGLLGEDDDVAPKLQRRRSRSVPAPYRSAAEILSAAQAAEEPQTKEIPLEDGAEVDGTATPTNEIERSQQSADQQEFNFTIDEIDKRKSLIDIKTLLAAVNGGYAPFVSKKEDITRDRPSSTASDQSFSLGDKENGIVPQQPIAEPQHMAGTNDELAQIGVATTSDQAVRPERTPSAAGTKSPSPTPMLGDGVSRASSIARSKYSPNLTQDTHPAQKEDTAAVAAATATAAAVAVSTAEAPTRDRPIEPNEQTLAALRESVQRASSPQAVQQATQESQIQPSNRKSIVPQYASPISAFNSQAQPNQVVQHPVSQQKQTVHEPQKNNQQLTSASIRAPEDFDLFVQSDEVVKYTLTPEPARDISASHAEALAQLTGQVPAVVQATAVNGMKERPKTGSLVPTNGLSEAEKKRHRWSITKPPSRNSSVHRRSGLMAREARVVTESTRDFADFIRSTKPEKEPQVQPLVTSQSSAALQSVRNSTNYSLPRSQSVASDRTRSLTRSDIDAGRAPPVPTIPGQNKPMQPKSAKANGQQNGELIAFIKDGPKETGQQRASRTSAAYRSTMDSDQFDSLKHASARPSSDARPDVTRGQSAASASSTQTSLRASMAGRPPYMNGLSMNGISNVANVSHPAYSGQPQSFGTISTHAGPEDMQRKRYRNKDPYAIESDEEEDISALPKGKRGGETLAEFLRNPDAKDDDDSKPIASASSLAQAREIMERARANTAKGTRPNSFYGGTSEDKVNQVTALPTSSKSNMEARPPTSGRAADRLGLNESSGTKDLADFLRNSGPPPSSAPAPSIGRGVQAQKSAQQKTPAKEEKKSRGFFSFLRRPSSKAGKAARHTDLP